MIVFIRLLIFIKTENNRFSEKITNKKDSKRLSQMATIKTNAY